MNKEKNDQFDKKTEEFKDYEKVDEVNVEEIPLATTDDTAQIVIEPMQGESVHAEIEETANVEEIPLDTSDENVDVIIPQPVQDVPNDTQEKPLSSENAIAGERVYTSVDDVPDVVIPESKLLQELEKSESLEAELLEDDEVIIRDGVKIPKYQKADIDFQKTDHDKRAMVAIVVVVILAVVAFVLLYFGVTPLIKEWQENQPATTVQPQETEKPTSEIVTITMEKPTAPNVATGIGFSGGQLHIQSVSIPAVRTAKSEFAVVSVVVIKNTEKDSAIGFTINLKNRATEKDVTVGEIVAEYQVEVYQNGQKLVEVSDGSYFTNPEITFLDKKIAPTAKGTIALVYRLNSSEKITLSRSVDDKQREDTFSIIA